MTTRTTADLKKNPGESAARLRWTMGGRPRHDKRVLAFAVERVDCLPAISSSRCFQLRFLRLATSKLRSAFLLQMQVPEEGEEAVLPASAV